LRSGQTQLVVRTVIREFGQTSTKVGETIEVGPDDRHALHWFDLETSQRMTDL
jgi:sn-glycerol 3-phosphate transport system ATP-binding protein